jgi:hypothetical protein
VRPQIIEDVVEGVGARTLRWADPVDHGSAVKLKEAFPRSVIAGEVKLEELVGGECLVFVEVETDLDISIGDHPEDVVNRFSLPTSRPSFPVGSRGVD